MTIPRSKIFIGSSIEGLDIAYALQECLEYDCDPTVWSQGVFEPSSSALMSLVSELDHSDFAAFIFSPDDVLQMRQTKKLAVRDNVIFEFGMFIGRLGVDRCFMLIPRGSNDLHLPSDLLGLTPLSFNPNRSDGRLLAALGPAANQIRRRIRNLGARGVRSGDEALRAVPSAIPNFVAEWQSEQMLEARDRIRNLSLDHYSDEAQRQRSYLRRIFVFFESMASAILEGAVEEKALKNEFRHVVLSYWSHASLMLAPPNHADDFWQPPPKLAELYKRWKE